MSTPIVIVAFPGVGKTHFATSHPDGTVIDLDRPDLTQEAYTTLFQSTYSAPGVKYILLPSWPWLSDVLVQLGIEYTLVYPNPALKTTYIERYRQRGSPDSFILSLEQNWDMYIESCMDRYATHKVVFTQPDQYLGTTMATILEFFRGTIQTSHFTGYPTMTDIPVDYRQPCERCNIITPADDLYDMDGKDGWGEVCEDCKDVIAGPYRDDIEWIYDRTIQPLNLSRNSSEELSPEANNHLTRIKAIKP